MADWHESGMIDICEGVSNSQLERWCDATLPLSDVTLHQYVYLWMLKYINTFFTLLNKCIMSINYIYFFIFAAENCYWSD